MAGEMGNEFSGLPMGDLIGAPLNAACDAQIRLAKATADFINTVGFNPEVGADGKALVGPDGKTPKMVPIGAPNPSPIYMSTFWMHRAKSFTRPAMSSSATAFPKSSSFPFPSTS